MLTVIVKITGGVYAVLTFSVTITGRCICSTNMD